MSKGMPSIEDLLTGEEPDAGEESAGGIFRKKQQEIKLKELERQTQKAAASSGLPYINLIGFAIDSEALMLIPEKEASRLKAACFYYDGANLKMAACEITPEVNDQFLKLSEKHHCKGEIFLISEHSFEYVLKLYKSIPKIKSFKRGLELSAESMNKFSAQFSSFRDLQEEIDKAQITDIISMILAASVKVGASDVHIEAEETHIKARFRIDGVLHEAAKIDKNLWSKIISRMKVLARVKINISDKPQDGRLSIYFENSRVDVRISFLPTNYGESVVMRLLRSNLASLAFEELGIRGSTFERLKREIERPNGMVITTGPTGSGKTTTLYSILKKLNSPETKIITVEDPIEYQLEGINQSQTSENFTFAQGLRSIVRQDPDVIMVGEIRDLETAEIAIQAALTGHLVLSTIHTNDAAGTVPRFLAMGAKPFLLAPAINAMVGQRLVRVLCPDCKTEAECDRETMDKAKELLLKIPEQERQGIDPDKMKFYISKGCEKCQNIGFKGRIGVYEVMTMNPEIEKLILSSNVSEYQMREIAEKNGILTMAQDGILKAVEGVTSLEEVFRVAG